MSTIMVIDDEFAIVETLCEILTWEGYRCIGAANGQAALEAISKERPDLIIADYMMPILDGIQMARALKGDPNTSSIPIILMTAAVMELPTSNEPWEAVLKKPFDVTALLRAVGKLLAQKSP